MNLKMWLPNFLLLKIWILLCLAHSKVTEKLLKFPNLLLYYQCSPLNNILESFKFMGVMGESICFCSKVMKILDKMKE